MNKDEVIYGKNPIEALLETNPKKINKIFLAKGIKFDQKIKKIIDLAKSNKIIIQEVPRERLDIIAQGVHQGIAASVSPIEYMEFSDFQQILKNKSDLSLVIILDEVEDPYNLGSIIRTANAAGADGVIIPKRRSSPVTSTVEKASAGSVEKIPIIQVTNLTNVIEKLKKNNFWIIGAESTGNQYYFGADYNINCALVLGGEHQGISALVKKHCDMLVKIPMSENVNSLNVANAASIIIYEVVRQRILKKNNLI
ncbi:MAG: 23S rRNA (guanosine(2251)-2'-O)-methyltransferase RlmB [bacterium]